VPLSGDSYIPFARHPNIHRFTPQLKHITIYLNQGYLFFASSANIQRATRQLVSLCHFIFGNFEQEAQRLMIVMAHPHHSPPPTPIQEEIRIALQQNRLESRPRILEEDTKDIEDELPGISTC
jgi:hypothetical protein